MHRPPHSSSILIARSGFSIRLGPQEEAGEFTVAKKARARIRGKYHSRVSLSHPPSRFFKLIDGRKRLFQPLQRSPQINISFFFFVSSARCPRWYFNLKETREGRVVI